MLNLLKLIKEKKLVKEYYKELVFYLKNIYQVEEKKIVYFNISEHSEKDFFVYFKGKIFYMENQEKKSLDFDFKTNLIH